MERLHPKIREFLAAKGLEGTELEDYLSPKPQRTYDPYLMPDIEEGAELILSCIDEGGKICIYGDYDADGVTATALLMDVLGELTDNIFYFLPSRFRDGYGLNKRALQEIKDRGADLVVTVDNGCVACDEIAFAKEIGLEVLVTDHHEMDRNPGCLCIDPKSPESEYPFSGLAGVGVAFKLAQVICDAAGLPGSVKTRNLDLVAVGTIADIVPLVDENRTLVKYGLRMVNIRRRPGLAALINAAGLGKEVMAENVAFGIGPRINAAGRMASAMTAAELMMEKDGRKAQKLALEVDGLNRERKAKQQRLVELCKEKLDGADEKDIIILKLEDAHEGITGIAAGNLKEDYRRPVIIMSRIEGGMYKGTSRSTEGIDMHRLLSVSAAKGLFESFGGHRAACGFVIKSENVDEFEETTVRALQEMAEAEPDILDCSAEADIVLDGRDVTFDFVRSQELLEPCGKDNERPLVQVLMDVRCSGRMGNAGQYFRFAGDCGGRELQAVVFDRVDEIEGAVNEAQRLRRPAVVTGCLQENCFNGRSELQILTEDVCVGGFA